MGQTLLTHLPLWGINLALAGLVCAHGIRRAPHLTFVAFVLALVMWSCGVKMVHLDVLSAWGLWWGRIAFTGSSLAGLSFVLFSQVFPDSRWWCVTRLARALVGLGVAITLCTLTPLVLRRVDLSSTGSVQPSYGPVYPLFAVFLLLAFGYGIWGLAHKWRRARGRSRLQIQYLWAGVGLLVCGAVTTNLIIPALTGNSRFSEYGPYFTVLLVGLTSHAIIRHRLMDIRVVIRRSVTYCLSLGITVALMWGILSCLRPLLDPQTSSAGVVLPLGVGLGGIVIFYPIRVRTQRLLDRYCYREPADYRQATRLMSQVLAGLVRLQPLCGYLSAFLRGTLKVESVAVYVCRDSGTLAQYALESMGGEGCFPQHLMATEMIALLSRTRAPVVREELEHWRNASEGDALHDVCAALQSEVLIPLLVEGRVAALLTVSGKLSGDPFFTHDLEFLDTVGHQASVALRRAQLYEEITWMKEYNESILRQMGSGVIAVDRHGHIAMVNATAVQFLGRAACAMTGQPMHEVLPQALSAPLQQALREAVTHTNDEATVILACGRKVPMAVSTSVLRGAEGEHAGAILVCHDLSRLKELEEEKRRIERLASIGTFVAGIAHEIKNPLVAIKTLAELLPEQYNDEEFRTTFCNVALHEVNRIDTLVQRLRGLGSPASLRLRPLSIIPPLEETLKLLAGELLKRHVTLVCHKAPDLPLIAGDHDQLKQVLLNLCLNSLEAMGQGGTLEIAVAVTPVCHDAPAALCIQIADTGPGIAPAYFATIFEPFVTSKETGSGLGLAICKGIIEHHRGTITAANRQGTSGAVFTVRFPLAQDEELYEVTATHSGYASATCAVA